MELMWKQVPRFKSVVIASFLTLIGCIALGKAAFTNHNNFFRWMLFTLIAVGISSALFMLRRIQRSFRENDEMLDRSVNALVLNNLVRAYVLSNVLFLIMSLVLMYVSRTHLI